MRGRWAVMTGSRTVIKGCQERIGRHIDLYCLVLVLGYGLTRALINLTYGVAVATTTGLFSLEGASLHFPIAASASIAIWGAVLAFYGCQRPQSRLLDAGVTAISIQTLINAGSVLGLFPPETPAVIEVALPILWGATSVVANVAWLVPFIALSGRRCVVTLSSCILFSSLICLILGRFPAEVQGLLLILSGIACVALFVLGHRMHLTGKVAFIPKGPQTRSEAIRRTAQQMRELWSPLLVYVAATVTLGFVSAFLASNPLNESSLTRNLATIAGAVLTTLLAILANRMFNLRKAFQAIFPVLALLLAILPFAGESIGAPIFHTLLVFLYTVVNASTLFLLVQTARVKGAPVVALTASFMCIARTCLVASLIAGAVLGSRLKVDDFVRMLVLVVVVIYILSMVLSGLVRNRQGLRASNLYRSLSEDEEDVRGSSETLAASSVAAPAEEAVPEAPEPQSIEQHASRIASLYKLTPREVEIAVLLAQGRSMPYIATKLGLSGNTIRSYAQETYAKLGVHSKQDLIDLFTQGEE